MKCSVLCSVLLLPQLKHSYFFFHSDPVLSAVCSCIRYFPQPELSAFLNLCKITLQITFTASFGYDVTKIIYYHSTVLGTVQTHIIEPVGIFFWHVLSHTPATTLEARSRFCEEKSLSHRLFFISLPPAPLCFTPLTAISTWLRGRQSKHKMPPTLQRWKRQWRKESGGREGSITSVQPHSRAAHQDVQMWRCQQRLLVELLLRQQGSDCAHAIMTCPISPLCYQLLTRFINPQPGRD